MKAAKGCIFPVLNDSLFCIYPYHNRSGQIQISPSINTPHHSVSAVDTLSSIPINKYRSTFFRIDLINMTTFSSFSMLCMFCVLFINSVSAAQITVINQCGYDISCAVVDGVDLSKGDPAPPPEPDFEPVTSDGKTVDTKSNIGQTLMCGKAAEVPGTITQLEWKFDTEFWFDVSIINGNPFKAGGFTVRTGYTQPPDGTAFPKCWDVWCTENADCPSSQVYTQSQDDRNKEDNPMRNCATDAHLTWFLCLTTAQKSQTRVLGPPAKNHTHSTTKFMG